LWFDPQTNIEPSIGTFIVSLSTTLSSNPPVNALWTTKIDNPSGLISFDLKGMSLAPTTEYFISVINLQPSGVPPGGTPAITTWLVSNDNLLGNVDPSFYVSGGPGGSAWRVAGIPANGYYPLEFEVLGNSIAPQAVLETSTTVPETSTWAMMLVGFAGLALAGYHRAKAGHGHS
jgi:hypothetical protein